jgi:O-antigen/teichoic acid export membrane protein
VSGTADTGHDLGAWTRLGARFGRHTGVYFGANVVAMLLGIVNVAVLTRFLRPADYGRLTALVLIAAWLGVLCTLGFLQGVNGRVFSGGGDAGDDFGGGGDDDDDAVDGAPAGDRRTALTSGLLLVVALAATLVLAGAWAAGPLAGGLLKDPSAADEIVLAITAGALGGIWRFVSNVPRYERRAATYVALHILRPVAVLAVSLPLVASGRGVHGAILGLVCGTALSIGCGLVAIRHSLALRFSRAEAREIERRGRPFLVLIASMTLLHTGDTWVLTQVSSDHSVGIYRVASRGAVFMTYFVGAVVMTFGPLRRTPAFAAIIEQRGRPQVGALFFRYLVVGSLGMLLVLCVGADVIVRILAPSYRGVASLLPLLGLGFFVHGVFTGLYRLSTFARRRLWMSLIGVVSVVVLAGASLSLYHVFGMSGVALGAVVAAAVAAVIVYAVQRRGREPLPIAWRPLAIAVALTAALYGAAHAASLAPQPVALLGGLAALLAFVPLLLRLGVIPRGHVAPLVAVLRSAVGLDRDRGLSERLEALPADERRALDTLLGDGRRPGRGRRGRGDPEPALFAAAARGIARLATAPDPGERAPAVGAYLFGAAGPADRDAAGRGLIASGVPAGELEALEGTVEALRVLPRTTWAREGAELTGAIRPRLAPTAPAG